MSRIACWMGRLFSSSGSALVEAAVVSPLLLLLVFGVPGTLAESCITASRWRTPLERARRSALSRSAI